MAVETLDSIKIAKIQKLEKSIASVKKCHIDVDDDCVTVTVPGNEIDNIYKFPKMEVKRMFESLYS